MLISFVFKFGLSIKYAQNNITWQPLMSIFVIGINHKTAPVTLREKVYFSLDKLSLYLQDLLNRGFTQEAVLLSTCNRSELYCETDDIDNIHDWFCAQTSLPRSELESAIYLHRDENAIAHIMEVACGLDSMILGEPQILGQMKEAFSESCTAGAIGALFHQLFQQVFSIAKEIRTTTSIGACPVSVASAAVYFARQQVPSFDQANVVMVGAGDTTELLLRYLKSQLSRPVTLVNRSVERAAALAAEFGGEVYGLEGLVTALEKADIVFSATGSPVPVVTKKIVAEAMQHRQARPLSLFDIAVPRDIDQFILELKSFDNVKHTIRAYRSQIEELCRTELLKAKHQLRQGAEPGEVLDAFAYAFTKKLLHGPSVQLRQAGVEGRFELLRFAKQLFAIPDTEAERL